VKRVTARSVGVSAARAMARVRTSPSGADSSMTPAVMALAALKRSPVRIAVAAVAWGKRSTISVDISGDSHVEINSRSSDQRIRSRITRQLMSAPSSRRRRKRGR
jgi:RNA 3'-terminal phosphate cyclase